MLGMIDDLVRFGRFHNPSQIHHRDPLADMLNHQQVVGNEEIGNAQLLLKLLKGVDDLRLNGYVQRGDRLVADDELGLHRQRPGNADALPLAAGKFVGVATGMVAVQPHQIQQMSDLFIPLLFAGIQMVDVQRLADDVADRHAGIQGRVGILKDDLHFLPVLGNVFRGDVNALVDHFAAGGLVQVQKAPTHGGFAAAAFPYQTQRFARVDGKADAVHRLQRRVLEPAGVDGKILLQVPDLQQMLRLRNLLFKLFTHEAFPPSVLRRKPA